MQLNSQEAELWLEVWLAVAPTCDRPDSPTKFADRCIADLRERYVKEDDDGVFRFSLTGEA